MDIINILHNTFPKDIILIIDDYIYGNVEYGEIISDIENMSYKKYEKINKIFNLNEKIYEKQKNHINHINELRLYKRLLNKFLNPLKYNMPINEYEEEIYLLINNPYYIVPLSILY